MNLMFIDRNPFMRNQLEEAARKLEINFISFCALEPALEYLKKHKVDGIVTAMGYQYRKDDPESFEDNAGDILLILLKSLKKEIPVLGNSAQAKFNRGIEYSYYTGTMPGELVWETFKNFISSIKDHDN